MEPKANAEAIKHTPEPVSLPLKIELMARMMPIQPVKKALIAADILRFMELILTNYILCLEYSSPFWPRFNSQN